MWLTIGKFNNMQTAINNPLIHRLDSDNECITERSIKRAQRDVYIIMDKDKLNTESSWTEDEIVLVSGWLSQMDKSIIHSTSFVSIK